MSERFNDVEVRERGLDADARRLNSVVLELNRLVAKLRWDAAVVERKRLEGERTTRAACWQRGMLPTFWSGTAAHHAAQTIREAVRRQEAEAEPVVRVRDRAAMRFAVDCWLWRPPPTARLRAPENEQASLKMTYGLREINKIAKSKPAGHDLKLANKKLAGVAASSYLGRSAAAWPAGFGALGPP